MKLWHGEKEIVMPGYTIIDHLVFDILATNSDRELNPFERLFIALGSKRNCNAVDLTNIYMACGCFEKAHEFYEAKVHHRKLGDLAWIFRDFTAAEGHYRNTTKGAQSYRTRPDYDRLIRLAFVQEDWDKVIHQLLEAGFTSASNNGKVNCGSNWVSSMPYLEMLAVAQQAVGGEPTQELLRILKEAFHLSEDEWMTFVSDGAYRDQKTIDRIKQRCPPIFARISPTNVDQAYNMGDTARAQTVLRYILRADGVVDEAQEFLVRFANESVGEDLTKFVDLVIGSGITSVSHSVVFAVMGHDSFSSVSISPERLIQLYTVHPVMNRRYFGKGLQLKFEQNHPLSGRDIVTGLFQKMPFIEDIFNTIIPKEGFDFKRLSQFRDWAEIRLDQWVQTTGAGSIQQVVSIWQNGTASEVSSFFGGTTKRPPKEPSDMNEWKVFLGEAALWLGEIWEEEIGKAHWILENQLFALLKGYLGPTLVEQHAEPIWVQPQHLSVYFPEASIAVDFMGEQHYRPSKFFGGNSGFAAIKLRDKRKKQHCTSNNIELIYVRYDEDVCTRASEIAEYTKQKLEELRIARQATTKMPSI